MKERKDIEEKYKWDLSCFGVNDQNFYEKCEEVKRLFPKMYDFKGKLNTDEDILQCLKLSDQINLKLNPISLYVYLKSVEDLSLSKYDEMSDYLEKMIIDYNQKALFLTQRLKQLTNSQISDMLKTEKFKSWRIMLEDLKANRKHRFTNSVDKFLSSADFFGGHQEIMHKFTDVDMFFDNIEDSKGNKHELNNINISTYLESGDRVLRKNALKTLHGTYGKYINMLSSNYIYEIKQNCFFARVSKFKNALEKSIFEEKADAKVYKTLIDKVRKNLPLLFDYFELKRKKLGLEDFYNYDDYASLEIDSNKKYSYEEAIEIIKNAVAPLGEEYVNLIQKAKDERWIDVFPNKNKRSGAFEINIYGYHPFVMLDYNYTLEDIFTLAHELGHAMHSYYSDKSQDFEKSQYTIFVAEVASTTNEMLLLNYLLKNANTNKEKEVYYNKLFESVKSTIFRQTMFAEFEEQAHNLHESCGALSKDRLCQMYYQLNKDYFGDKVKLLEEVQYEWARIPHFFNSFYVYKYAIGLICALNFASKLSQDDKGVKEKYINNFLCAGCSKKPVEILKEAGCDLFDEKTYQKTFDFLKDMLKEWEQV